MTINTLKVTDLEFDTIKANLKSWMKTNSNFTDFEYEASGLSSMLDVLAYNTHYNSVLANFMANEMFLDTSLKRSSVISHAKALGYKPRSVVGARATISIVVNSLNLNTGYTAPDVFIIRRGTRFVSSVGNSSYQFVAFSDYSAAKVGTTYTFPEIEIIQGEYNSYAWIVNSTEYSTKYVIPNVNCDTSTVKLEVYDNNTSLNHTSWTQATTLLDIVDKTDKIYFVQESANGRHEIYFGNGTTSSMPLVGNVIRIEYITSSGDGANGVHSFYVQDAITHDGNLAITGNVTLTTLSSSTGGASIENINEIKYFAANHFAVQNRAVTSSDYEAIIRENFSNVASIKVWGGEDNNPKQFGSVFVCIKPHYGEFITEREQKTISALLAQKSIMNQKIRYVNPSYIYIDVDCYSYYTPSMVSAFTDLSLIIKANILSYSNSSLEKFSEVYRHSVLTNLIDSADPAIKSNITKVKMVKLLSPMLNKSTTYTINYANAIKSDAFSVMSSYFSVAGSTEKVMQTRNRILKVYNIGIFVGCPNE